MGDDDDLTVEYLIGDDETAPPAPLASPGPVASPGAPPPPRRSRRALVLGLLGLLVVAGVGGALLIGPGPAAPDPSDAVLPPTGTARRIELDRAGVSGRAGGSLAGDAATLAQIRDRVAELSATNGHGLTASTEVIVLWAGDLDAGRYAAALYRQGDGWSTAVLAGPAGAPAGQLEEAQWNDYAAGTGNPLTQPSATFVSRPGAGGAGAVLVIAPRVKGVEIAAARRFRPGGAVSTTWRSLQKQGGSVWAGRLSENEAYLSTFRTTSPALDQVGVTAGQPDGRAAAQAVATGPAAGSVDGRNAIDCAADQVRLSGASPADRPVLAVTSRLGARATMGAVVLSSPDGGWLWGMCDREWETGADRIEQQTDYPGGGIAPERWNSPDQAMAAVPARVAGLNDQALGPPRLAVLAPLGADHVRVGRTTTAVRDRFAMVTLPYLDNPRDVTVEALSDRRVIGRITARADW